ncbi:signal peptidase I [Enterococcus lactis]
MYKYIRKFFSVTITGLLVSLIALMLYMQISSNHLFSFFNVLSESMKPTIPLGALVVTKTVTMEELKIGDVITYELDGKKVTHRIVSQLEENGDRMYITRGDANNTEDRLPVNEKQIMGKMIYSLPKVGRFGEIISTRVGAIALCLTSIQLGLMFEWIKLCCRLQKEQSSEKTDGSSVSYTDSSPINL